jgi:hypothetical protein
MLILFIQVVMFGCEIGCRVLVVEDKGKFVQRERRRLTGGGGIERFRE